jgi:hypothetical protein
VKYVVWSNDSSLVALMSKHSESSLFLFEIWNDLSISCSYHYLK